VFLNGYADRLAIQHQTSLSAVGVYGIAFRIVVVVSLLLLGVQGATTPLVLSRHAEPETPRDLAQVFRLFWALGCVVFLVLSILAEPLVRLLSAQAYFGAARVVPYLVPAAFLAGLYVFAPGPIIAKRTRAFAGFNVGAGLLNLGLAFALVPGLGIVGAGVATAASSMLLFIALMILSQRLYPVPHNWLRIGSGAGAATVIVVLTRILLVSRWDEALGAGSLIARILISVLGSLVVLAILVDGRELRRLGGWTSQARGLRVRAPSPDSAQR
jgi:O-antigen/teichoic acid export membrane protein